MRVLSLNRCAALREVGFDIEEDGVVANITKRQSIAGLREEIAHATGNKCCC